MICCRNIVKKLLINVKNIVQKVVDVKKLIPNLGNKSILSTKVFEVPMRINKMNNNSNINCKKY